MSVYRKIDSFVRWIIENSSFTDMDSIYLRNKLLAILNETEYESGEDIEKITDHLRSMDELIERAFENGVEKSKDVLEAEILDLITPSPAHLNEKFWELYKQNVEQATDYFYTLSQKNNYIKTREIAQNQQFLVNTDYGELDITINLSKPEKSIKDIMQAAKTTKNYPKCPLCMDHEGHLGGGNQPARSNHRLIRMTLNNEKWAFQYSPYAYYNEHAIILAQEHYPMKISLDTFQRLTEFVTRFPHYFIGSNAGLPIVGGSILSHEHYQAGRYTFPMEKAPLEKKVILTGFNQVTAHTIKWPMSVIRLQSKNREEICKAADYLLQKWENYTDETVQIVAKTPDGQLHHTVTPIARLKNGIYELDIVLRDNNVSDEFPDGIFHPHQDVQHIKKENIGLIEVMGLAILPPRLKREMAEVEKYLLNQPNDMAAYHKDWADRLKQQTITPDNVQTIIQQGIGDTFARVLEDAGVYKRTPNGQQAFQKFLNSL